MTTQSIAFIGGGNMARALIGGLLAKGTANSAIHVAEPNAGNRDNLTVEFSVSTSANNQHAAKKANIWILATKPQVLRDVCMDLAPLAQQNKPLIISIAAGITTVQLSRWLGGNLAIVRTMPNTPALLGAGVTGLFANQNTTPAQRAAAESILTSAGKTVWLEDETWMDAVTAVSGSGPAYVFLLAEAMQAAAQREGLPAAAAQTLTVETLLGAARMLIESGENATVLRQRVTSPGGTTQAALDTFHQGGFHTLVEKAIHAARIRGAELSAANDIDD